MSDTAKGHIIDAQGMSALERTIAQIKADHSSISLVGLWYGRGDAFDNYVKIAEDAGFMMHPCNTDSELSDKIKSLEPICFILVVFEFLPKSFRNILAEACEKFDPLYIIHITSSFGIDPETRHRSIITSFCSDVYADSTACRRVSDRTYNLFDRANAEALGVDERSTIDLGDLLTTISRRARAHSSREGSA